MKAVIKPSAISGSLTVPPSKSYTQRALAAALITQGTSHIGNLGSSDDERTALEIIQELGATVAQRAASSLTITGNGIHPRSAIVYCGESGLCARLFTPIAAIAPRQMTVTGQGSLLARPMRLWEDVLPQLGVSVTGRDGKLPLTIQGPLQPKNLEIDGSLSSQFLSGLLIAIAAVCKAPVTLSCSNLVSGSYAAMTVEVLHRFGWPVRQEGELFHIRARQKGHPAVVSYTVPADWSSAAPVLVAGAIAGKVEAFGLDLQSVQPDSALLAILQETGAVCSLRWESLSVGKGLLRPFQFDATDCPDLFPVLAVLAAFCKGESAIVGLHRLAHKESNRAESIAAMLEAFSVDFQVDGDVLFVNGGRQLRAATVNSFNDHRIVMATAVAALRADGPVTIEGAEAVAKSYPDFFRDLQLLGGEVFLEEG